MIPGVSVWRDGQIVDIELTEIEKRQAETHEPRPLLVQLLILPLHQRLENDARHVAILAAHEHKADREGRQRRDLHARRLVRNMRQQELEEVLSVRTGVGKPKADDARRFERDGVVCDVLS